MTDQDFAELFARLETATKIRKAIAEASDFRNKLISAAAISISAKSEKWYIGELSFPISQYKDEFIDLVDKRINALKAEYRNW